MAGEVAEVGKRSGEGIYIDCHGSPVDGESRNDSEVNRAAGQGRHLTIPRGRRPKRNG